MPSVTLHDIPLLVTAIKQQTNFTNKHNRSQYVQAEAIKTMKMMTMVIMRMLMLMMMMDDSIAGRNKYN